MNTFTVTVKSVSETIELFEFCAARGFALEGKAPAITVPTAMSENYMKPSEAMKKFCGPEWANKYGLIQPKAALELVIKTIQRGGGILITSEMVQLNDALRYALNTQLGSVLISDLPQLVNACFEEMA